MDPISDMLIRIKNAERAGHESVQVSHSKYKMEIAKALERAGWVGAVERKGKRVRKFLEISLKSKSAKHISNVKFLSKPSRRLYAGAADLPLARHGGTVIVTTSRGVMSALEARKEKIGGQLIAEIW